MAHSFLVSLCRPKFTFPKAPFPSIFPILYCCYNHSIGKPEHSKDCLKFEDTREYFNIQPWLEDPLMFHRFDFLKKFKNFHRFLNRGALYIQIDTDVHTDIGSTNFHN